MMFAAMVSAAAALPAVGQDLRVVCELGPNSMDPHRHNFGGSKSFAPHFLEPLVRPDAAQRPVPALATSRRAAKPRRWTVVLRF
jgi:peptide/nickel transport system substrate-binding protein